MNEKLNVQQVMKKWASEVRGSGSDHYRYSKRKEHIELLMAYFDKNGIEMDEASLMKRHVVDVLVHEKGMKDQGEYKGWKKNVEQDFEDWIQRLYVPSITVSKSNLDYEQDPEIVAWAKARYGNDIHPQLMKDCHTIGNILNIKFIDEFYKLKEVRNG